MSRQAGWYWVKEDALSPRWEAAEWCPEFNGWSVSANEEWVRDENLLAVGDRIPTPDEPWQCVPVEATADMLDVLTLGHLVTAPRRWREALAAAPKPGGINE
ncbi:hypothetical protein [Halomonas litopenaei]|uniref:hypothetical protein n=1 Tax=Halomonas litopenaei TaxID=2109328 RepID=UPI001A8C3C46|nr:hypothetical protein [Halomonas litopenaei]MBN8410733.1 hypothetical protein [Halomonas litopenaei]